MNASLANPSATTSEAYAPSLTVLIVIEPGFAGAFGHVEGLIHYLVGENQRVHLAYSSRRPGPRLPALLDFVRSHAGKILDLDVGNAPSLGDFPAFLKLKKFAKEIQPDIIHSHSSKAGVLARALAFSGIGARQIYTPHAYYGLAGRPGLKSAVFNAVESFFGRFGRTIAVSGDEREFAIESLKIDPAKCLVIPIAVDTDTFTPAIAEAKRKARAQLGLPEDAVILGWMGRLSFQKDPQTLLRAFAKIDQTKTKCHLVQVGQGEEKAKLDQLASELGLGPNFTQLSHLSEPQLFYEAINALILTSRYEGCPTVAIEALSANLPLILSQAPGTQWLARCQLSHLWSAPVGDATGFAQAIAQCLADLSAKRASNHREFALQRFSTAQVYRAILETYRAKQPARSP
jgi:glycosyltransferase involved in cell wall biosynthesis